MGAEAYAAALRAAGWALAPGVISSAEALALGEALDALDSDTGASRRRGAVYARRNLADLPLVAALCARPEVAALARLVVGERWRVVRALLFDKREGANWSVPWHQDLSVIVRERAEVPGWGPWSVKAGAVHVQPPAATLERLVALRLHLDDCPGEQGALRVLPTTHRLGRLDPERIASLRERIPEVVCPARRGDILLMRPLLLHASSPATRPDRRRILHLEIAPEDLLPPALSWR